MVAAALGGFGADEMGDADDMSDAGLPDDAGLPGGAAGLPRSGKRGAADRASD